MDPSVQILEIALEVCLVVSATSARSTPGAAFSLSSKNASSSRSMLMWWKSAVNLSFFLSLATFRMRSSACDTLSRLCVRRVLCWPAFPLVPALRSTGSAAFRRRSLRRGLPLCSPASQLLWRGPTSRARASSATAPRLPDADRRTRYSPDTDGQTRDLPGSDAILLHVMWPSTPAGRQHLA